MSFLSGLDPTADDGIVSSNTADTAWATVPIEDDPTAPDISGYALVSDIADFARPLPGLEQVTGDPAANAIDYGQDLNFDFDAGEPIGVQYGTINYVSDEPQVQQWVAKALMIQSGRYLIYPLTYGSILPSLVGAAGPDQTIFSEVSRTVQECIIAHPRVRAATVDTVARQPLAGSDALFIAATMTLDTSDDPTQITMLAGA